MVEALIFAPIVAFWSILLGIWIERRAPQVSDAQRARADRLQLEVAEYQVFCDQVVADLQTSVDHLPDQRRLTLVPAPSACVETAALLHFPERPTHLQGAQR